MDLERNYWSSRVSRRGVLRGAAIGGAGLAGAALIGCGSSSKPAAPAASNAPATGGSAAPAGEQPVVSDAFIMVQTRDAVSLEPLDANVYTVPERVGLVYPRLLTTVLSDPKDSTSTKFVPSYAIAGMEVTNNGTQMTFKVKPGVKYQKIAPLNGRDFTSDDIKYSINRYMTNSKSTFQSRFSDIASMETPDKQTFVIKLKSPSRYLVSSLAAETALITPPETDDPANGYKKVAIGPGPFIHDQYLQGEGSQLHKNPDFIDAAHVYYNKYQIKVITDAATRNSALKTSAIDYIDSPGFTPSDVKTIQGPSVTIFPIVGTSTQNISWNMNNPKWKDYRLRLAMSKAFDRQEYIDTTFQGAGEFSGIVPVDQGKPALSVDEVKAHNVQKYDPAEAKKLFDAAGAKPGMTVEYYFSSNGTVDNLQMQLVARKWKENLGIDTTLKTEDYSIYLPKAYLGALGPGGGYPDMYTTGYGIPNWMEHLFAPYLKGGNRNGSNFFDQKVTDMLNDLKGTLDDGQAFEKSRTIQKYIWENHLPMTPRPAAVASGGFNSKLRLFYPGNYPPGMEFTVGSWKSK